MAAAGDSVVAEAKSEDALGVATAGAEVQAGFARVPADVWSVLLQFVDTTASMRLSACTAWLRQIVLDGLTELRAPAAGRTPLALARFIPRLPALNRLQLMFNLVGKDGIAVLRAAAGVPRLQSLSIVSHQFGPPDSLLAELLPSLTSLTELKLATPLAETRRLGVDDACPLIDSLRSCKSLRQLSLYCDVPDGLACLFRSLRTLTELTHVKQLPAITQHDCALLVDSLCCMPQLVQLSLNPRWWPHDALPKLAASCTQLQQLELYFDAGHRLTHDEVSALCSLRKLRALEVSGWHLNDTATCLLASLAAQEDCALRQLVMLSCEAPSDDDWQQLFAAVLPKLPLTELSLWCCTAHGRTLSSAAHTALFTAVEQHSSLQAMGLDGVGSDELPSLVRALLRSPVQRWALDAEYGCSELFLQLLTQLSAGWAADGCRVKQLTFGAPFPSGERALELLLAAMYDWTSLRELNVLLIDWPVSQLQQLIDRALERSWMPTWLRCALTKEAHAALVGDSQAVGRAGVLLRSD